jgi:DinB superfamily
VTGLSQAEALAVLQEGQSQLQELLGSLSDDDLVRPATIGGGEWSAKDLIGHVAFCEEIGLVTIEAWLRGERPPIEATFGSGNVDEQNAANQERKRSWTLTRVRADSDETHRRLVASIQALSGEQWMTPRPFQGDQPEHLASELGGVLGAPGRPFGHAFAHLPDLEAFVDTVRVVER